MSEQQPEASVPEVQALPEPDPDFPESSRVEIRASQPPDERETFITRSSSPEGDD